MRKNFNRLAYTSALLLAVLAGGPRIPVAAVALMDPPPPLGQGEQPKKGEPEMYDDWHRPVRKMGISPSAAANSDHFGYKLVEAPTFAWVDASSGTEVFIEGEDRDDNYTEAIDIGFEFRFYERTYDQLFIGTNGFVTFDEGSMSFNNRPFPGDTPPNGMIAPFWDDLDIADGKVYYQSLDGVAGRTFVVEWYRVIRYNSDPNMVLTFELILFENGDILFQYRNLNGILDEATVGIEDGDGVDGLLYLHKSPGLSSGKAIKFIRPDPGARVKVTPLYQSGFAIPGRAVFKLNLINTNEEGWDIFDLTATLSDTEWNLAFFASDTRTMLTDHDNDGIVDTGRLDHEKSTMIVVKVWSPTDATVGDYTEIEIKATSSDNTQKSWITRVQVAVPAGFAQAYADSQTGMYLSLTWAINSDNLQVANFFTGNTLSLTMREGGGYVYSWEKNGEKFIGGQPVQFSDIETILLDDFGDISRPLALLTNNGDVATPQLLVNARYPALANAPDGSTGIIWAEYKLDLNTFLTNSNIYFAILDPDGKVSFGPLNVTNNDGWRGQGEDEVPAFNSPQIVATEDNRYFLAWIDGRHQPGGEISSVYYSIYKSGGVRVKGPTLFAQSIPGSTLNIDPGLADLSENRVLIAYSIFDQNAQTYSVAYAIVQSDGDLIKDSTIVPESSGWRLDAAQLKTGNILIAWTNPTTERIAFIILDQSGNDLISSSQDLPLLGERKPDYVSVTTSEEGYGILTWMDAEWKDYLYYTLVNENGDVLTPAMIFISGQAVNPLIQTSFSGQGIAAYKGKWQTFMPTVNRK